MDKRTWHSDPLFPVTEGLNFEESDKCLVDVSDDTSSQIVFERTNSASPRISRNGTMQEESLVKTSTSFNGHVNGVQHASPGLTSSSIKGKLPFYGSQSARRDGTFSNRKQSMYSTKELDETLSRLQKENFHLKIQITLLERRLNDESVLDDGESSRDFLRTVFEENFKLNIQNEIRVKELEFEIEQLNSELVDRRNIAEAQAKETVAAFNQGYEKAREGLSHHLVFRSSVDKVTSNDTAQRDQELSQARQAGHEEARQKFQREMLNKSIMTESTPYTQIQEQELNGVLPSLTDAEHSRLVEEALRAGYSQALRDVENRPVAIVAKPLMVDCGSDAKVPPNELAAEQTPLNNNLDITLYQDFPSTGTRMGASSAMSAFGATRLANSEARTVNSRSPVSVAPLASSPLGRKGVTPLERKTFKMLLDRLVELVDFLSHGLNGSFNDSSLNTSAAAFCEFGLNISVTQENGNGDGAHVSFCLATKLQELVDISREISFHEIEVETDDNWKDLHEEIEKATAQIEMLKNDLAEAQGTVSMSAQNQSVLVDRISKMEAGHRVQVDEMLNNRNRLTTKLESVEEEKAMLQEELAALVDQISGLEDQMAKHHTDQLFILQHTARRPDCDANTATDVTMDALDKEAKMAEDIATRSTMQVESLTSQLRAIEGRSLELESQVNAFSNMMDDLEKLDEEKRALETVVDDLTTVSRQLSDKLQELQENNSGLQNQLQDVDEKKMILEAEFTTYRAVKEEEMKENDQKIIGMKQELAAALNYRETTSQDLYAVRGEISTVRHQLEIAQNSVQEQAVIRRRLENMLNKDSKDASLQTDVVWASLKAEKAHLVDAVTKLVEEVETLEGAIATIRVSSETKLEAKEHELQSLISKIDLLATGSESLLNQKEKLEEEVGKLRRMIAETEHKLSVSEEERLELTSNVDKVKEKEDKLLKWEKAVHRQIGKTQKVINQANQNIENINRGGVSKAVLVNPLVENQSIPKNPRGH